MPCYHIQRGYTIFKEKGLKKLLYIIAKYLAYKLSKLKRNERVYIITKLNSVTNGLKYHCPPNPYQTITINPLDINYIVHNKSELSVCKPHNGGFAQIRQGNWSCDNENIQNIDEHFIKKSLKKRFLRNYNWKKTEYYSYLMGEYSETYGVNKAEKKTMDKLSSIDDLYYSMKENGYDKGVNTGTVYKKEYRDQLDPFVIIDRDGEILLWDGRHRVIIAQMLNIKIPVIVVCRHKGWQAIRENVCEYGFQEGMSKQILNHPDLQRISE